jgi:hypothetical protein
MSSFGAAISRSIKPMRSPQLRRPSSQPTTIEEGAGRLSAELKSGEIFVTIPESCRLEIAQQGTVKWADSTPTAPPANQGVWFGVAESITVVLTIVFVLWTAAKTFVPKPWIAVENLVASVVIVFVLARNGRSLRAIGLQPKSWTAGLGDLAAWTAIGCAAIAGVGYGFGVVGNVKHFDLWMMRNIPIHLVQQLILQVIIFPRVATIFGERRRLSIAASATIFSLLHLPNPVLTILTLIAGYVWVDWYDRRRSLLPLWISHALLASSTIYFLNGPLLNSLRVGIHYFAVR